MEISTADWKLFQERVSVWQEHYMAQLAKEYIELLSSNEEASTKFWKLEKRIKQDKKNPGVLTERKRSAAIWDIAYFVGKGVISLDALDGFSEDAVNKVKHILNRSKYVH